MVPFDWNIVNFLEQYERRTLLWTTVLYKIGMEAYKDLKTENDVRELLHAVALMTHVANKMRPKGEDE